MQVSSIIASQIDFLNPIFCRSFSKRRRVSCSTSVLLRRRILPALGWLGFVLFSVSSHVAAMSHGAADAT